MLVSQERGKVVVLFDGRPMRGGERGKGCSRFCSFCGFENESSL